MEENIKVWLENLGLDKYADGFVNHDVGPDVLAYLTEDHLKELGVSLGDRLRLLQAIKIETGEATEAIPIAAPAPKDTTPRAAVDAAKYSAAASAPPPAPAVSDAERRPLTVMFCDLADSTALSARLDPEDLQDVIRGYQETCTALIQEYEGFVAKYMGDGILVYFGYPKSLERNAERAIRSALSIVDAMVGLNQTLGRDKDIEIAVRIGIATGMVMVGEVVGEGMAQERTVIGEAPNIAARMQGVAGRNGIVVGSLTREIAGDVFTYEDLGARELKGVSGQVQTWGVTGLRDEAAREADFGDSDDSTDVPELVGRDEEIGLLRRAWQSVKDEGRGQVVTLSGEAGIGKSVLIDGRKAEIRTEDLPQLTMRCSPYHTNSALYPVIEHFKRLARWQPTDDAASRLEKLEVMLTHYNQPLGESMPLMASLLSLTLPADRYPPLELTPQQQKQQTQDMIIGITMDVAESRPFLQVWEDLHWADPSTLELIGLLIEQAPTAALLMVLTARPEFIPPWPTRSHITPITLNRLERPHAEALVARIAGTKLLPAEVVDHIVVKTDGVPLYVEELTKTILASDILRDAGDHLELTGPLSSLAIPDTLQESLMARLDRLPQVRELAQLGSVLGREFAYEMISGLSTSGDTILQEGLGQLVDAELLYQRGRPPQSKYIFKHALVQDAAYGSLLRRTRQQYHLQTAELLEARFPDIVEAHPEIVAQHYSEAGHTEQSVDYFLKAGEKALRGSANAEAIAHLTEGLELLRTLPEDVERARRELKFLMMLGPALIAGKGYAAPEVEHTYHRALELSRELEHASQQFMALYGVWNFTMHRGDIDAARKIAEQLVDLAKDGQDSGLVLASHRSLGYALHYLGRLEEGRSHLERVVSMYDPDVHGSVASRHGGADHCTGSLCFLSWSDWALGFADQAIVHNEDALALAGRLDHPLSATFGHLSAAIVHQLRGEPEANLAHAEATLAIAEENAFELWIAWASVLRGSARFELGSSIEAITEMRSAIAASRATGTAVLVPYWLSLLASALGRNGQAPEGLVLVDEGLADIARTGEGLWEANLHQLRGQLQLDSDVANAPEAEASFHTAIDIARSRKTRSWELRAATSLARLWHDQGNPDDARDLLTPVHDWFTEGFDTADLKASKKLLDELT